MTIINANIDDWIGFCMMAPATPTTANGGGTGNCNLVPVPGSIIIPAAGNGAHDVDLNTAANANLTGVGDPYPRLVTQAVPVPAMAADGVSYNGYWDWSDIDGSIAMSVPGKGRYNLFTFEIRLIRYIEKWPVFAGTGQTYTHYFKINHNGGDLLPHWILRTHVTRDATHDPTDPPVHCIIGLYMSRQFTA